MRRSLAVFGRFCLGRRAFVVLEDAGYFAKEPLLFLRILAILTVSRLGGGRQSLLAATSKEPREQARHPALLIAGLAGLSSRDEGGDVIVWTGWSCEAVGCLIQLHIHDACGLGERFHAGILRQRRCLLHKLSPDRRSGLRPAQAQVAVIVITDPNDTQQIGGVSREPAIMRTPGLTGGWQRKAAQAHRRITQAVVDYAFHHVGHDVGNARVEYLALVGFEIRDYVAFRIT